MIEEVGDLANIHSKSICDNLIKNIHLRDMMNNVWQKNFQRSLRLIYPSSMKRPALRWKRNCSFQSNSNGPLSGEVAELVHVSDL